MFTINFFLDNLDLRNLLKIKCNIEVLVEYIFRDKNFCDRILSYIKNRGIDYQIVPEWHFAIESMVHYPILKMFSDKDFKYCFNLTIPIKLNSSMDNGIRDLHLISNYIEYLIYEYIVDNKI